METTTKKIKYTWLKLLSYEDRQRIVGYYLEGYGLYRIGETFGVTASTIEYHLKNANVFIPYKRPTLFHHIQEEVDRKQKQVAIKTLNSYLPQDSSTHYFDEKGDRYPRPKSYAQLLRQSRYIQSKKPVIKVEEPKQDKGFLIRVSLSTGTCIIQEKGHYTITQVNQDKESLTSTSTISW